MQTPLQEFISDILSGKVIDTLANKQYYLEKEKQMVIDAFDRGVEDDYLVLCGENTVSKNGEQYYNEKYNADVVIKKEILPLMDIPCLTIKEVAPIFGRFYLDGSIDALDRLTLKLEKLVESKLPPTT